jgi:hypothetical protein
MEAIICVSGSPLVENCTISGTWVDLGFNLNEDARSCDPFECAEAPAIGGDCQLNASSPCRVDASPCGVLVGRALSSRAIPARILAGDHRRRSVDEDAAETRITVP